MKNIRLRVVALAIWLVIIPFISGILSPATLSKVTFGFVLVMVVAGLVLPRKTLVQRSAIMFVFIAALLIVKFMSGELLGYQTIFLAVLEICVITITLILSGWVGTSLTGFENAVAKLTLGQHDRRFEPALTGQGSIYREVRRARNHQRPLALISIGVDQKTIDLAEDKLVQEVQRSMLKQYKLRGLSKLLSEQLEDCAVIVQDDDRYLVVLPDILPEEILFVVERLRKKALHEVGLDIKIGVATLPGDGFTFEGLVEKANQKMQCDREPQHTPVIDQHPVEQRPIK